MESRQMETVEIAKKYFCDIVNSVRSPAIDGKTCGSWIGSAVAGGLHGGPIVARRNALSCVVALLRTTSHRPVSGLASDVIDVSPVAFPRVNAVA